MIERVGISPQLTDLGIGSILAKIRQGSLPVGFGWEPIPAHAVYQSKEARYLLTGAMFDLVDAAGIIMPDSLIKDHPEAAVGWLKAGFDADGNGGLIPNEDFETALAVIEEIERGKSKRSTARRADVTRSTVGNIIDQKDRYKTTSVEQT